MMEFNGGGRKATLDDIKLFGWSALIGPKPEAAAATAKTAWDGNLAFCMSSFFVFA